MNFRSVFAFFSSFFWFLEEWGVEIVCVDHDNKRFGAYCPLLTWEIAISGDEKMIFVCAVFIQGILLFPKLV